MQEMYPLESSWIVAVASGIIAIILLLQLARSLPLQNILLIIVVLLLGEGALGYFLIGLSRTEVTGAMWCFVGGAALLWLAVILAARWLAQEILRPWREEKVYGLWLLALSGVGAALFQFGWPGLNSADYDSALDIGPAAELAAIRGVTTIILLACLMPWFLRKRPKASRRVKSPSELAQQPENKTQ